MATETVLHELWQPGVRQPVDAETPAAAEPTPTEEVVAALREIVQLAGLTDEELRWLAAHGQERKAASGALIFREGEPACSLTCAAASPGPWRCLSGVPAR